MKTLVRRPRSGECAVCSTSSSLALWLFYQALWVSLASCPPSLLFFLPGGLINPPQRWAAVIGSRRKPLLSSQGWLAGAQEEMEHSLQSVNCSRANHLSAGSRERDAAEFRAGTINNTQSCAPEENKAAHVRFLGKQRCSEFCRPEDVCSMSQ